MLHYHKLLALIAVAAMIRYVQDVYNAMAEQWGDTKEGPEWVNKYERLDC